MRCYGFGAWRDLWSPAAGSTAAMTSRGRQREAARDFSCRSAGGIPDTLPQRHLAPFPLWVKLHTQTDEGRKGTCHALTTCQTPSS